MEYNIRNPKFASADGTFIDVEWEHPVHGWIPFTAHADDSEATGREIFALVVDGQYGDIAPYVVPPGLTAPEEPTPEIDLGVL